MTRDIFPSEHQQSDSLESETTRFTSKTAQEAICNHLLEKVKITPAETVLTEFSNLFIDGAGRCGTDLYKALESLILNQNEDDFINTIKRCCYILINNWHANRNYQPVSRMIDMLDRLEEDETLSSPILIQLRIWMTNFLKSPAYKELKLFALPSSDENQVYRGLEERKKRQKSWINRYRSYLLVAQSLDTNNSEEQREVASKLSKQIKDGFKFKLAMYTARYDSPTYRYQPLDNPTNLGDRAIFLIKKVVSRHNLFNYANRAKIWLEHIEQLDYKIFKRELNDYLVVSMSKEPSISILKSKLSEKLEILYEDYHDYILNKDLLLRTSQRLIEFFTSEDGKTPSVLFILLTNTGNPLTLTILLLKIMMLCRSVRTHLEVCIAKLIQYYDRCPEEDCQRFINFLEVFDLVFTIYTENVKYDLIKINPNGPQNVRVEDLKDYRLFCRSKGIQLDDRDLTGADLSGADLRHSELQHGKLSEANLSGANLHGSNLSHTDLSGAHLQQVNLSSADLTHANLAGANLEGADLRGANLSGANLEGADLSGAELDRSNLREADLSRAILRQASLRHANLSGANLSRADLTRTQLSYVNLSHTNLSNVFLRHTNLSEAHLNHANLIGANLYSTDLTGAQVKGAQFGGNSGLSPETKQDLALRGALFS